jgi:hypothetical protein
LLNKAIASVMGSFAFFFMIVTAFAQESPTPAPTTARFSPSYPPCLVITIKEGSPRSLPIPSGSPTPMPTQVEHCWLRPGVVITLVNDVGGRKVRTFIGYAPRSDRRCKGGPPCYAWQEEDSRWTVRPLIFMDGDLSIYREHYPGNGPGEPPLLRYMRWPLTVNDSFSYDYTWARS